MRNTCVNKAAGIGVIIAVIIGIVIVSAAISMDFSDENTSSVSEEIEIEVSEEVEVSEVVEEPEVVEEKGRDLSVELSESLKMKTP